MSPAARRLLLWSALPFGIAALLIVALILQRLQNRHRPVVVTSGPALPAGFTQPKLSLGFSAGALITPDGRLWIWGFLPGAGAGVLPPSQVPTLLAPESRWTHVSMGAYHGVAIREDGTLWGLGYNFLGQLGTPQGGISNLVQLADGTHWTAAAAGDSWTLALQSDGSLWQIGQLASIQGTAPLRPLTRIDSTNHWTAIAAGGYGAFALDSHGALFVLDRRAGKDAQIQIDTNHTWSGLDADRGTLAAAREDVLFSSEFQIPAAPSSRPSDFSLRPIRGSAGGQWSGMPIAAPEAVIARRSDGSWWAIGRNTQGRFGLAHTSDASELTRLPWPAETLALDASHASVAAFLADGSLWYAGNEYLIPGAAPRSSPARDFQRILVGIGSLFLRQGGASFAPHSTVPVKLWTWPGTTPNAPTNAPAPAAPPSDPTP